MTTKPEWESEFDKQFVKSIQFKHFKHEELFVDQASAIRKFVRKLLASQLAARDEFWKKQEMGVASDCHEHCEQALTGTIKVEELKDKILSIRFHDEKEIHREAYNLALRHVLALLDESK